MLPKKYRLPSDLISKILKDNNCKYIYNNFFLAKYTKNNLKNSRIAVIVSTKVTKKAVVRNKLKRKVVFCFYDYFKENNKGIDLIIIIKKNAVFLDKKRFIAEILSLFKCINI